jgi:hypothetical protein
MRTNPAFRLVPNVHCVYFRFRQQYQMWPRAINRSNPWTPSADTTNPKSVDMIRGHTMPDRVLIGLLSCRDVFPIRRTIHPFPYQIILLCLV